MTELSSTRPGGWGDPAAPVPAPLALHRSRVLPAWVDYNGHMSEWAYLLVMGDGSDAFFRYVGIDDDYRASGRSLYTVETHIRNLREASLGDELALTLIVLGVDAKRVHVAHEIRHADDLIATGEQMLLHVDSTRAATTPMPDALLDRVTQIAAAHAAVPRPDWAGRAIRTPGKA